MLGINYNLCVHLLSDTRLLTAPSIRCESGPCLWVLSVIPISISWSTRLILIATHKSTHTRSNAHRRRTCACTHAHTHIALKGQDEKGEKKCSGITRPGVWWSFLRGSLLIRPVRHKQPDLETIIRLIFLTSGLINQTGQVHKFTVLLSWQSSILQHICNMPKWSLAASPCRYLTLNTM